MRSVSLLLFFALLLLPLQAEVFWQRVAQGYDRPVDLQPLPSERGFAGKFFLLEQKGTIYLTDLKGSQQLVLDWTDRVTRKGNEQGFLSLALAADFSSTGRTYFNLTNKKGDTEIWRYTFNLKNLAEASAPPELLLTFDQPYNNHNGGWLGFGPDKMLYIATGDGGSRNDPKNFAQDLSSFLGKILRIDVSPAQGYRIPSSNPFLNQDGVRPEIYALGLRNPWRCTWAGKSFVIADVGQNAHEEINVVTQSQLRGANFGWRITEGNIPTPKIKPSSHQPVAIKPVITYPHDSGRDPGGHSITGGHLYQGPVKEMQGRYLFADYAVSRIWSFKLTSTRISDLQPHHQRINPDAGSLTNISSFGLDNKKNIYALCFSGDLFKLRKR